MRTEFMLLSLLSVFFFGGLSAGAQLPPLGGPITGGGMPSLYKLAPQPKLEEYWLHAKKEVDKSVLELIAQHQAELDKGLRVNKLMHGDPAKKEIALTFDDGPHSYYTRKILDILKSNRVKATFFLVGEKVLEHPELARAEVAEGHVPGNHTFHHVNLTRIPEQDVASEVVACGDAILAATGRKPRLFRPPGGDYDPQVAGVVDALGYTLILWTDNPGDYASPGTGKIETRVTSRITNGGIILMHDGVQETLDALPVIIEDLKKKGFSFVGIEDMLREKPDQGHN
jgi:peptidoglycan/xylan/chitin deacetylase (PgdA/CDA1 family)